MNKILIISMIGMFLGIALAHAGVSQFRAQFAQELAGDQVQYNLDQAAIDSDNQAMQSDNNDMNVRLADQQVMLNDENAMQSIINGIDNGSIQ